MGEGMHSHCFLKAFRGFRKARVFAFEGILPKSKFEEGVSQSNRLYLTVRVHTARSTVSIR